MAISDSYDWNVTRDDIIQSALEDAGILGEGMPISPEHLRKGARELNLIAQQWATQADYAAGEKVWARKRAYLFLEKNKTEYLLGPAGDHCTYSYVTTTTKNVEAASSTSIEVNSIAGIADADNFAVLLDDGTLYWDIVSGAPSGDTVTITTGLSSQAAAGARVFAYTSKIQRPHEVLTAVRRNVNNEDEPMGMFDSLAEYESLFDKTEEGTPYNVYTEEEVASVRLYVDYSPTDLTDVIRMAVHRPLADFDATQDTPDFPKTWNRALIKELAVALCPKYERVASPDLKQQRDEAVAIARNLYAATTPLYFEPERLE